MLTNLYHPELLSSAYKLLNVLSIVSPGNQKEKSILCSIHPLTVRYLQAQFELPLMKSLENHHNQQWQRLQDFQSTAKNKGPQRRDQNLQVYGSSIY